MRALTMVELYVVSLTIFDQYLARLWCAFTTESMAVAYANSETLTPKVWKSLLYEFDNTKMLQGEGLTSSQNFATSPRAECLACLYHCSSLARVAGKDGFSCWELQLCK